MLKHLLLVSCISFTTFMFSQETMEERRNILKDIENAREVSHVFIDSSTIVATAIRRTGPVEFHELYLIKIKNGKYSSKFIEATHREVFNNKEESSFVKAGNKIYRIRPDKVKKETHYYKDEIVGGKLNVAETPFFKGGIEEGFEGKIHISSSKNTFVMRTYSVKKGKIDKTAIAVFDNQSMKLVSQNTIVFPEENRVSMQQIHTFETDNNVFTYYPSYDKEKGVSRINIFFPKEGKMKQMICEDKSGAYFMDFVLYEQNGNIFLYNFTTGKEWLNTIYSINIENEEVDKLNESTIPLDRIVRDYTNKSGKVKLAEQLDYSNFATYSVSKDLNGDVYIFNYATYGLTDGTYNYFDVLVTKISEGEVKWNQYFRRSTSLTIAARNVFPDIKIKENLVEVLDYEYAAFFDKKGNYIPGEQPVRLVDKNDYTIEINKETGDLKRLYPTGK